MAEEEKNMRKRAQKYDTSQIQVLEGLEVIRRRPGMYIGSTSGEGLHRLVWETVDNSTDEVLVGFAKSTQVIIEPDGSITAIGDSHGIPVRIQAKTGRPTVETVFTVLHAGGKFGGGGYKVPDSLHDVGSSVINALLTSLDVRVCKDGKVYHREYRRGAVVDDLKIIEETDCHRITVYSIPDPEIFTETAIYDLDKLVIWVHELTFLNRGLHTLIGDRREGQEDRREYYCENGIKSYVEHLNINKGVIFPEPIFIKGEQRDIIVEASVQCTDSYHLNALGFANNIHIYEDETHESSFKTSLTRAINNYARKQKLMKENDEGSAGKDACEGLTIVASIKHPDP